MVILLDRFLMRFDSIHGEARIESHVRVAILAAFFAFYRVDIDYCSHLHAPTFTVY